MGRPSSKSTAITTALKDIGVGIASAYWIAKMAQLSLVEGRLAANTNGGMLVFDIGTMVPRLLK